MHLPYTSISHNSLHFEIEPLSPPENLLEEQPLEQLALPHKHYSIKEWNY